MSTLQIQDSFQPYYAGREEAEAAARSKPVADAKSVGKPAVKIPTRKPPAPPRPKLGRFGQD